MHSSAYLRIAQRAVRKVSKSTNTYIEVAWQGYESDNRLCVGVHLIKFKNACRNLGQVDNMGLSKRKNVSISTEQIYNV
jgi:hypothetical protein